VSTRTTPPKTTSAPPPRLLTIGTVCRRLKSEYPDISISKIRYLEDQGLLTPRRTQGGYRLFSEDDVERLQTILKLQRDEFLPLRVIRQELASPSAKERKRRRAAGLLGPEDEVDLDRLCERAGVSAELARELEEYGLLAPRVEGGERLYTESDVEIALACGKLSRFGIAPRHLRAFRTAADREAGLLEAVVAPALRSRNPERRQAALEELQMLGALAHEVSQLLFWRELRRQAVV
jgi:DNA-binding transcriptional MerR regulator